MQPKMFAAATLALLALAGQALADDEQYRCYTTSDPRCSGDFCGNTFYNPTVSMNWQQTLQNADPRAMARLAGVYYMELPNPQMQMINRAYRDYEANGVWGYQDQTCSSTGCSQNQGAGQWAAYEQRDGSIFLMVHFSDLARTNACFSQTVQLSPRGFTDSAGGNWQRVR